MALSKDSPDIEVSFQNQGRMKKHTILLLLQERSSILNTGWTTAKDLRPEMSVSARNLIPIKKVVMRIHQFNSDTNLNILVADNQVR